MPTPILPNLATNALAQQSNFMLPMSAGSFASESLGSSYSVPLQETVLPSTGPVPLYPPTPSGTLRGLIPPGEMMQNESFSAMQETMSPSSMLPTPQDIPQQEPLYDAGDLNTDINNGYFPVIREGPYPLKGHHIEGMPNLGAHHQSRNSI
ncbi:hypothetical protein KEM55_000967 [Ascosphaera atra]|nr:hypothetical protein KEM55_000967 [Ascosphaera atra]